jgi:hypothetical protein
MAKLLFLDKEFADQSYDLVLEKTTVGRAENNTLVIHDPSVSMHHCEILVNGPEVIVCELGSSNGTFVQGSKISKQAQIKSGQTVRFGNVSARLELDWGAAADDGTAITAIYSVRTLAREEAHRKAQPHDPSAKLGPALSAMSDEHTIIMPRPPAPKPGLTSPPVEQPKAAGSRCLRNTIILTTVILALGLVVLLWLLRGAR